MLDKICESDMIKTEFKRLVESRFGAERHSVPFLKNISIPAVIEYVRTNSVPLYVDLMSCGDVHVSLKPRFLN